MKKFLYSTLSLGLLFLASGLSQEARAADPGIEIGVLNCEAVAGTRLNLIIHSSVDLKCVFNSPGGAEYYNGETGIGLGVDLNLKGVEKISFAVLGVTSDYRVGSHSLAGKYLGAKASASVGVGVGAAVLVGGGEKNFSLSPNPLEGNTRLGAAGGLGYLYIEPAR